MLLQKRMIRRAMRWMTEPSSEHAASPSAPPAATFFQSMFSVESQLWGCVGCARCFLEPA